MRYVVAWLLLLTACATQTPASVVPRGTTTPLQSEAPSTAPATSSPTPTSRAGTTITTFDWDYGPMLFDASGQAIYLFDLESTARPRCYEECAEAWPPVLTRGEPVARGQVRQGLLGTTERTDGTTQVTYAGHPLYFYAHEGKRQVLCHDIEEYGGVWLVVQPDGSPAPG